MPYEYTCPVCKKIATCEVEHGMTEVECRHCNCDSRVSSDKVIVWLGLPTMDINTLHDLFPDAENKLATEEVIEAMDAYGVHATSNLYERVVFLREHGIEKFRTMLIRK